MSRELSHRQRSKFSHGVKARKDPRKLAKETKQHTSKKAYNRREWGQTDVEELNEHND